MKPYHIKRYSYNQAKKLHVSIYPSTKPNKKIDVYKDGIYITSIGYKGMMDYPSYIETEGKKYADERRRLYHLRHSKDNIKGTKGWYALNLLW
jgi:hypothetical protein